MEENIFSRPYQEVVFSVESESASGKNNTIDFDWFLALVSIV